MKPSICTASGIEFDPFDPRVENVRIDDIAHALANTCRFGGHTREFYSVAQHSILVSQYLPRNLALYGLLHDAGEAYLLDVPSPIKQFATFLLPGVPEPVRWGDVESHVRLTIEHAFGLPPLDQHSRGRIHAADRAALEFERASLMPMVDWWPIRQAPMPMKALPPAEAKAAFLSRAKALLLQDNAS